MGLATVHQLRPRQTADDLDLILERFAAFLDKSKLSHHTIAAYNNQARNYVAWLRGPDSVDVEDAFTDKVGAEYAITAWKRWRLRQRHAPRSVRQALSAVILLYQAIIHIQVDIEQMKVTEVAAPDALSREETLRLRKAVDREAKRTWLGIRDAAIIFLFLECGLRLEEMANLLLADIRLTKYTGDVRIIGKGDKVRYVDIPKGARKRLAAWLNVHATMADASEVALFIGFYGRPLSRATIKELVSEKYAKLADIPDLHAHRLRHTYATTCQRRGMNPVVLQHNLGHASPKTTAVYTRPTRDEIKQETERVFDYDDLAG